MSAILKHELRSYFHSLTAYIFGAFLLAFVGIGDPEKGTDEPHHSGRFQIDEDCLKNSVAFYAQYAVDYLNE